MNVDFISVKQIRSFLHTMWTTFFLNLQLLVTSAFFLWGGQNMLSILWWIRAWCWDYLSSLHETHLDIYITILYTQRKSQDAISTWWWCWIQKWSFLLLFLYFKEPKKSAHWPYCPIYFLTGKCYKQNGSAKIFMYVHWSIMVNIVIPIITGNFVCKGFNIA